jgi:hypothetical protein
MKFPWTFHGIPIPGQTCFALCAAFRTTSPHSYQFLLFVRPIYCSQFTVPFSVRGCVHSNLFAFRDFPDRPASPYRQTRRLLYAVSRHSIEEKITWQRSVAIRTCTAPTVRSANGSLAPKRTKRVCWVLAEMGLGGGSMRVERPMLSEKTKIRRCECLRQLAVNKFVVWLGT